MNIYSISTGCYSDIEEITLTHVNKFTDDEFLDMCKTALKELRITEEFPYLLGVDTVAKYLCKEHGFKIPKYPNCHLFDYSNNDGDLPEIFKKG